MKKTFLYYIKLSLALLLFLQVGQVSAQTSCTVNGVTITATGTSAGAYAGSAAGCTSSSFTGSGAWTGSSTTTGVLVYTFSNPVISAQIAYTAVNGTAGQKDIGTITTNGGGTITLSNPCNVSISGTVVTGSNTTTIGRDAQVTVTSTQPFTTITIVNTGGESGFVQGQLCNFTFTPCNAGATAPTLSSTTIANACPTATLNLNPLVTSTLPTNASLKWYTDAAHTTEVTTPTAVDTSGTYYAFYVDTVNNCYSPASAAVTATVTLCPVNITNTCPSSSVDLANSFTGSKPLGYELTYHTGTPATTANMLTSSVVTTPGTYYGAYYLAGQQCYTATGRPLVVTFTDCCAAKIAPDLTK